MPFAVNASVWGSTCRRYVGERSILRYDAHADTLHSAVRTLHSFTQRYGVESNLSLSIFKVLLLCTKKDDHYFCTLQCG